MEFYDDGLFHIYNQGNNKRQIFFSDDNFHFFLWKMRAYLTPFGDLVAWCLMPNHFHWMIYVKKCRITRLNFFKYVDKVEYERRLEKYGSKAINVSREWQRSNTTDKEITLNEAIGILQGGYGRAINKLNDWSGRLFKDNCQAKDGWIDEFVTLEKNGRTDFRFTLGNDYIYHCFNYIHENPVNANLVEKAVDYPWSSAQDYADIREGTLCNLELGRKLISNF